MSRVGERRPAVRRFFPTEATGRVLRGVGLLGAVTVVGTAGYVVLGLGLLDAAYQTVTTISTVGFRELEPDPSSEFKVFTIAVVMGGVGTAFYTLGVLVESVVEGRLSDHLGRRRMERTIESLAGHVIVCGFGRVGRTIAAHIAGMGHGVVVVEHDPDRVALVPHLVVAGDATDDNVLRTAGIGRAATLVAALDTDAANLYVTLTGRSLDPDLLILARARVESAEPKFIQAGADRVVNPQQIGGARMAALAVQPNVADFFDIVMHDGSLEFRLAEVSIPEASTLAGKSLLDAQIRERTGALVLAMRVRGGEFVTNPQANTVIEPGHVLIAIGTKTQLATLTEAART